MTRRRRGFYLIELMIVVTIIGILSAIAIPTYMGVQKKATRSEFRTNLQTLRLLEEKHFAEFGRYIGGDTIADLMVEFHEFRPVDPDHPDRLAYDYAVAVPADGQTFSVTATGKANSRDAGYTCNVDQENRQNPEGCLQ